MHWFFNESESNQKHTLDDHNKDFHFQHYLPYIRLPVMRLFSLLLLLPMVLSCQPKPGRCGNEELLLKPLGDSLPVFELAAGMPALDGFLDSMLVLQLKDPENLMRLYLRDSLYSPCSFDPRTMGSNERVCNLRPVFEILLNANGQLLVESELETIERLDTLWKENVWNRGVDPNLASEPKKAIVLLVFPIDASMDSLAKILTVLHQSHNTLITAELASHFPGPFCDIPADSVQAIMDNYPLKIYISRNTDIRYPPPPPPVPHRQPR